MADEPWEGESVEPRRALIALVSQLWWTLSASWGTVIARNRSFYYALDCRNVNTHVLWLCFVENGCGVCVEPVVVFPALHWQPWRSSIFSALCWALLSLSLSIQIAIGGLLLLFFFPNIIPIIIFVSILEYFWFFSCYGQSNKSDILSDVNVLLQSSSCQCNRYVYIVSFVLSILFAIIVMF